MNHLPQSFENNNMVISNFFSKIRGDIRKSSCTTVINDTGGKFATGAISFSNSCSFTLILNSNQPIFNLFGVSKLKSTEMYIYFLGY
jgi:hypothetical protein